MNIALLTAAGSGIRMHTEIPKQFIHVNNKPIILYTLERFQNCEQIDAIILVTLPNWIEIVKAYARQYNISKLKWIIEGGKTGQESIKKAIDCLEKNCSKDDVVLIHDGNRPMIDDEIINDSLATFNKYGSAVACIPCNEAIFKSEDAISSDEFIPREKLFRTQTPHTYKLEKLVWAHKEAKNKNINNTTATCTLMRLLGEEIFFSNGKEKNLKITTHDDLDIFKSLLQGEQNGK